MTALYTQDVLEIDARVGGVRRSKTASQNATALQSLINDMSPKGGCVVIREPYACDPLILRKNVSLRGPNGPQLKGPYPYSGSEGVSAVPGGPAFLITSTSTPFLTLEGSNTIDGLVFHYPEQNYATSDGTNLVDYPATITKASGNRYSISVKGCSFIGATTGISLLGTNSSTDYLADIEIDLCYGYPLGENPGAFVDLSYVMDIARISRCHVNPGAGRNFLGERGVGTNCPIAASLIDYVCENSSPSFRVNNADEVMMDMNFVFGSSVGFNITESYGGLTQCRADMVQIGFDISINAAHKYVALVAMNAIPSAGPDTSARSAIRFSGSNGFLKVIGGHAFLGTNIVVPSSSSPSANAFLVVDGTNAQRADLYSCTKSALSGSWANHIANSNVDSVVNQSP